jgi:hypothetical protein
VGEVDGDVVGAELVGATLGAGVVSTQHLRCTPPAVGQQLPERPSAAQSGCAEHSAGGGGAVGGGSGGLDGGDTVGEAVVGEAVGAAVMGAAVGEGVSPGRVGDALGEALGELLGEAVGGAAVHWFHLSTAASRSEPDHISDPSTFCVALWQSSQLYIVNAISMRAQKTTISLSISVVLVARQVTVTRESAPGHRTWS